jgi:uncharacterized protein
LTLYPDTSLLVATLTKEANTDRMQTRLAEQEPDDLAISDWVTTEFSSALSIRLRARQMSAVHRAEALAMFTRLSADSPAILPVTGLQFRTAARFADQYALRLRAADALHLAIRADHGATLCTLDRRLCEAGPSLGVKTMAL